ncbi:Ctr copper transporter [Polychytrium aggregatum]|uniref:Ctr copper transporter n=1 Tax=Polychytrium aggregatum TaxID=110093 RepID=UPI0022FE0229|nr:Ctr copper transporter [Polychytrium aggregatum]KAI9206811.1 Ctr copper transporter [Polychytrium aggregatum]
MSQPHSSSVMTLSWGTDNVVIFSFWHTQGVLSLVLSCIVIFLLSFFQQFFKFFRALQDSKFSWVGLQSSSSSSTIMTSLSILKTDTTALPVPIQDHPRSSLDIGEDETHIDQSHSEPGALHTLRPNSRYNGTQIVRTALYLIDIILSTFLMLVLMTLNGWLILSYVLGSSIGFYIYSPSTSPSVPQYHAAHH